MFCYHCQTEIIVEFKVRREDTCPKCSSYLHCCKNCDLYDISSPQQCREPIAELVQNKESGNFCNYFKPADGKSRQDKAADEARKKLEELFKKK
ncbi:MAG: hypothetical protein H6696_04880 [Deferribacteres bacterium]|nr:hypothetical protein [candidate division KSB1 bacterium]MCB9501250.1 hypothetical protein [Deferribacteres bacterium]